MNLFRLVIKSFRHYVLSHMAVATGIAISTAVITGSLIVGDSITHSLMKSASLRLGRITHLVHADDRFFSTGLARQLDQEYNATPVMQLEGIALAGGGRMRLNRVQVWGLKPGFGEVAGSLPGLDSLMEGEAIISSNVAARLGLGKGDFFQLRIRKASHVPSNAPFVSDRSTTLSQRLKIREIAGAEELGRLNTRISQTAPYNVFLSLDWLSRIQGLEGMCNRIMISSESATGTSMMQSLARHWSARDASLGLSYLPEADELKISTPRVFIDSITAAYLQSFFPESKPVLTYFANALRSGDSMVPYSFVSGLAGTGLRANEIMVNRWLADELSLAPGDTLSLDYYEIGPLRTLTETSRSFRIREILPMDSPYADRELAPFIPGLSDAGSCSEWEAGVPIDLSLIRDEDEAYWNEYRGTPKAFVSLKTATRLWENRFGVFTSLRVPRQALQEALPGDTGNTLNEAELRKLEDILMKGLSPEQLGFEVNSLAGEARHSAVNGVDFSQLFAGLSFFVLLSGILLTLLLLQLNLLQRSSETGTLNALGWPARLIRRTVLLENAGMVLIGTLAGGLLALLYTRAVFAGLNRLWFDIVRTTVLEVKIQAGTVVMGLLISVLLSFVVMLLYTRRLLLKKPALVQRRQTSAYSRRTRMLWFGTGLLLAASAFVIIIMQLLHGQKQDPAFFFIAGGLLLVSIPMFALVILDRLRSQQVVRPGIRVLMQRNLSHNLSRSMIIIILMALGTFLVLSTGANRKNPFQSALDRSGGTGGFLFFAESTIPVLHDLNDPANRREEGLMVPSEFVQFRVSEGDDASCLNLNRISNPRIIATNPGKLEGRFRFTTRTPYLDEAEPWASLNREIPGVVPAIADQTVIQWGLGKRVGDTLHYLNERGEPLRLLLVGGLAPSVFQGNVLISERHFLDHFPSSSGSNLFLVEGDPGNQEAIEEDLNATFRDLGWEMQPTAERLAAFNSVNNTYLSIFMIMGTFGLILGTIGLAVVLVRNMQERRYEIAVLSAGGYPAGRIRRIITGEYIRLLLGGVLGGSVTAWIATLPVFLAEGSEISTGFLALLAGIILVNGWIWIQLLARHQLRKISLLEALRNE